MEINNKDGIELGASLSASRRMLAYFSIIIVYFFYCYNFLIGGYIRPTLHGSYGFSIQQLSSIFGALSFGTIPGTIVAGYFCIWFGKKRTLIGIALAIAIFTALPLLDPTKFSLWLIARLVTGFSLGGVFGTAQPLVMQLFPPRRRARFAAIVTSMFSIAVIVGGQLYSLLGNSHWRGFLWVAVWPMVIGALAVFLFVPSDAKLAKTVRKDAKSNKESGVGYINMYRGKYLWIGIGAIVLSGINFIAYSGYSNNLPTYLKGLGVAAAVTGNATSIQGIGQLIGYNFWGAMSDKFGRKIPIIGLVLMAFIILVVAFFHSNMHVFVLYAIMLVMGLSVGYSGAWGAYYTELFPKKFRSIAAGISFNGGRILSATLLPVITGISSTALGIRGVYFIAAGVAAVGVVVWALLPETLKRKRANAGGEIA